MDEPAFPQHAEIFISYAAEDRAVAARLADELEARGWSVWWDRDIVPGTVFSQVIEEALTAAACVIVLWSPAAVDSNWVQSEAAEALARNTLVPATVEDCRLPLEFRRIEAAQIGRRWDADDDEFVALLEAVAGKVSRSSQSSQSSKAVGAVGPRRPGTSDRRNRWLIAGAALLGISVLALVALASLPEGTPDAVRATPTSTATSETAVAPSDPLARLAAKPITERGIGPIVVGMRGDEIRDVLPEGLAVERYDRQGPLVDTEGITVLAPSGDVAMYALASTGEGPQLDVLIFVDRAFRTVEGVGPGTLITDATLHYGFATLSFNTSNESREFVDFAYSPYTDIAFRVDDPRGTFAGIYPTPWNEYNETTDYRDDARIGTVWVMCRQSCPG